MSTVPQDRGDVAVRARAWRHAAHSAVCDVVEPWAHGTVVRATRYPSYFDFNLVRVESEPGMSVDELVAFTDEALAGLAHPRIDFDVVEAADARRAEFEARGWTALRLLWMRHGGGPGPGAPEMGVEAVPYEAVHELRVCWMAEDGMPEPDAAGYHAQAREVALAQGAEVLAVREAGQLVAFAQLVRSGAAAEIHQVFVLPAFRGRGRGTALTRAAIAAAGDVDDLWICADDEKRAKDLYARLGFVPAWRAMEITRVP
jgi:GNAT superfamily N-acetyltransferase